jgi:hypothetical protein
MPEEVLALQAKVRQVRRRQLLQLLLWHLPFCMIGAIVLTALWYVVQPFTGIPLAWTGAVAIFGGLALVMTVALSFIRLPSRVHSSLSLDEAFGLRERVTTAVTLSEVQRASPAGIALLEDTRKRIASVDVPARFPITLPRTTWFVPLAATALAVLIIFYNPIRTPAAIGAKPGDQAKKKEEIKPINTEEIKQQIAERRKRKTDLHSEMFDQLETDLDKLLEKVDKAETDAEKQVALQDLSKLAAEMAQRQKELGKLASLQQQLRSNSDLKDSKEGPAKDLQEALSKGNLEDAKKQLEKLAQALKDGKMSDEDKKKLSEQLKDLQQKLSEMAELKKRRDNIAKSNLDPETKKKELEKLDKQAQKLQEAAKLAQQLSQCQQCLEKNDAGAMAKALDDAQKTLEEMAMDAKEAAELELALEDMEKLKETLGLKDPKSGGGEGMEEEEGESDLNETENPEYRDPVKRRSKGGLRKETANDTNSKNERARSPLDPKGKILFHGYDRDQPKPDRDSIGKTTVDIAPGLTETKQQASEALRQQKVPQPQRDLVTDFYKNLVEQGQKKK